MDLVDVVLAKALDQGWVLGEDDSAVFRLAHPDGATIVGDDLYSLATGMVRLATFDTGGA